jgi:membrane-associated phospholipid phosphatase
MANVRRVRAAIVSAATVSWMLASAGQARADGESIYRVHPVVDGVTIGASVALVGTMYAFGDGLIDVRCPCDPNEVNSFDRPAIGNHSNTAATISDITVGATLLVPVALDYFALNGDLRVYIQDLTVFAEALAVSGAINVVVKVAVGRPVPRTYEGDPSLVHSTNGYHSMYSGHTTLAFTALSVSSVTIGERYGIKFWPWVATAVIGGSVAAERVAAGWHFPTDVIVGALAGTAVGIAIPVLHFRRLGFWPDTSLLADGKGATFGFSGRWN